MKNVIVWTSTAEPLFREWEPQEDQVTSAFLERVGAAGQTLCIVKEQSELWNNGFPQKMLSPRGNVFLSLKFPVFLLGLITGKLHANMCLNPAIFQDPGHIFISSSS